MYNTTKFESNHTSKAEVHCLRTTSSTWSAFIELKEASGLTADELLIKLLKSYHSK